MLGDRLRRYGQRIGSREKNKREREGGGRGDIIYFLRENFVRVTAVFDPQGGKFPFVLTVRFLGKGKCVLGHAEVTAIGV